MNKWLPIVLILFSIQASSQKVEWIKEFPFSGIEGLTISENEIFLAGSENVNEAWSGDPGFYIYNLNADGNISWQVKDSTATYVNGFADASQTLSIIQNDKWNVYNVNGTLLKKIVVENGFHKIVSNNNSYYVVDSYNDKLRKYNSEFKQEWEKSVDNLYATKAIIANNKILLHQKPFNSNNKAILCYDTLGNLIWSKPLPGGVYVNNMSADEDGNCYITAKYLGSPSFDGITINCSDCIYGNNYLIGKLNNNGSWQWVRRSENFGSVSSYAVKQTQYLFIGEIIDGQMPEARLTIYNKNTGAHIKSTSIPLANNYYEIKYIITAEKAIYVAGNTGQYPRAFLGKITDESLNLPDDEASTEIKKIKRKELDLSIYPNPSNNIFTIEGQLNGANIEVINNTGQLVYQETNLKGNILKIELSKQAKGVYFIKIINWEAVEVKKLIIE